VTTVTHLGLDVHKETIAVAILREADRIPDHRTIPNTPEALRKLIRTLNRSQQLRACYEAGPTGYDTQRLLSSWDIPCEVIAPALIPRRAGLRVKTDRLDASALARLHRAGELTPIRIPSPQEEAVRDLIRVREDLKDDKRRVQQRLKQFLLRHGKRYAGNSRGWSARFEEWVRSVRFDEVATQRAFDHLLAARDNRATQLSAIEAEIADAVLLPPLEPNVSRLLCMRGLNVLSAATIAAEVCDFRRFPTARAFMAFTGLVPSEHSSGATERRGGITKTGNAHVRRVLVEAAWICRHRPAISDGLRKRSQGQPQEVLDFCWRAQTRLNSRYRRLSVHKTGHKVVVAVAREMSGFIWGLMNDRF
jgi:transposase